MDSEIGSQIHIELSSRRELSLPEDRLVQQWHANAYFTADNGDPDRKVIGHAHVVKCPLGRGQVFDILDSLEADLHRQFRRHRSCVRGPG